MAKKNTKTSPKDSIRGAVGCIRFGRQSLLMDYAYLVVGMELGIKDKQRLEKGD